MTWLRRLIAFREAHHSALVKGLEALPKYPAPRRQVTRHPIGNLKSFDDWCARHAPEHKRSA